MQDGLIKPVLFSLARHLYLLATDTGYRNYHLLASKLGSTSRFVACNAKVSGWNLALPDAASFLSAYKEIFVEHIYSFKSGLTAPRILDLGANIGLSVLYFKQLYPAAEITAYEADPSIFHYLEQNVHGNGYSDVRLVNKAVWDRNTTIRFKSEGADGGRVKFNDDSDLISVEAVDVREILDAGEYDLLKMDIEGAEEHVLPACKDHLNRFRHVFIEYHSVVGKKQCLDRIISLLSDIGFRVHIHSVFSSPSPFSELHINSEFDLQLNIFGWRE